MRRLALLLVPAALVAGQARYARLGEFQGNVEVQLTAADPWMPAERNLPLTEAAWVRTGADARLEIELDDGSAWRLGPNSMGEISDYSTLSTGQRITLLSLDHGMAYFSGEPHGNDVLMLVAPGAQVTLGQGARIRLSAESGWSQFSVLEGMVRFSSPSAEMGLREGQSARVEPASPQRFFLYPEVTALDLDRWSEARDKAEAAPPSAAHVTWRYGLADLDGSGEWLQTKDSGVVWRPRVAEGWKPYQLGRWHYYDALGFTWVSNDPWGWMPYHNGRWLYTNDHGWVWQPSVSTVFKPGEVYWVEAANFGWGPLAPGEQWAPPMTGQTARFYAAGLTTYAALQADTRTVDPAGFATPGADQLKTAGPVVAPPSPRFVASRLDATRPILKVGSTRIDPTVPGVTFSDAQPPADVMTAPPDPQAQPPVVISDAPPGGGGLPDGVYPVPPVAVPVVEVPVVVNPPDHPTYSQRGPWAQAPPGSAPAGQNVQNGQGQQSTNGTGASNKTSQVVHGNGNTGPVHDHAQSNTQGSGTQGSGSTTIGASPVTAHPGGVPVHNRPPVSSPPPASAPPAKVEAPKIDVTKPDVSNVGGKKVAKAMSPAETEVYSRVANAATPQQALVELNVWSARFPKSAFGVERQYFYINVYSELGSPDKVLAAAAPLMSAGVRNEFENPSVALQILMKSAASLEKLPKPTVAELATGQEAAYQLLSFLPEYFALRNRPAAVSESAWLRTRDQVDALARQTLAKATKTLRASN